MNICRSEIAEDLKCVQTSFLNGHLPKKKVTCSEEMKKVPLPSSINLHTFKLILVKETFDSDKFACQHATCALRNKEIVLTVHPEHNHPIFTWIVYIFTSTCVKTENVSDVFSSKLTVFVFLPSNVSVCCQRRAQKSPQHTGR